MIDKKQPATIPHLARGLQWNMKMLRVGGLNLVRKTVLQYHYVGLLEYYCKIWL